jgi:hypothetical protein
MAKIRYQKISLRDSILVAFVCVPFMVLFLFGDVLRVGFLSLLERWG